MAADDTAATVLTITLKFSDAQGAQVSDHINWYPEHVTRNMWYQVLTRTLGKIITPDSRDSYW